MKTRETTIFDKHGNPVTAIITGAFRGEVERDPELDWTSTSAGLLDAGEHNEPNAT